MSIAAKTKAYLNIFFWLFSTYLLAPYFYARIFLINLRRNQEPKNVKSPKILVIHVGKIGDLVNVTPIFREIKERFPSAHLSVLVISKAAGVLRNNHRVDKMILFDDYKGITGQLKLLRELKREKYDWSFNILPNYFTGIISFWSLIQDRVTTTHKYSGETAQLISIFSNHRLEYKRQTPLMSHHLNLLKFIGIEGASDKRELFILPEEEKKASGFLTDHNLNDDDLLIGISVTAGIKIKEWQLEGFAKVADKLIEEKNAKIIFVGGRQDNPCIEEARKIMQNNSINTAGRFELWELPALLKKLKLFISVDTGPLCMAVTLDVPVVDIAGFIDITELYPLSARSKIVQKSIPCVPCAHMFYAPRSCKEKHLRCLRDITVEEVFQTAASIINNL